MSVIYKHVSCISSWVLGSSWKLWRVLFDSCLCSWVALWKQFVLLVFSIQSCHLMNMWSFKFLALHRLKNIDSSDPLASSTMATCRRSHSYWEKMSYYCFPNSEGAESYHVMAKQKFVPLDFHSPIMVVSSLSRNLLKGFTAQEHS